MRNIKLLVVTVFATISTAYAAQQTTQFNPNSELNDISYNIAIPYCAGLLISLDDNTMKHKPVVPIQTLQYYEREFSALLSVELSKSVPSAVYKHYTRGYKDAVGSDLTGIKQKIQECQEEMDAE